MAVIIEPFRIKVVEPIKMSSPEERLHFLEEAGLNLFKVPSEKILIDLLTDSGTGAMSSDQWSAIMRGDESYAGSPSFLRFEAAVKDIYGFKHVIPTHQGRAAERILAATMVKPGNVVPNNTHFDTTRANIEAVGATAIDLPCLEAKDLGVYADFKGNMDLVALEKVLNENEGNVPLVILTVTNNGGGGQPVSMANIKAVSAMCRQHNIPFYLDACRFAENAWFIKTREEGYAEKEVIDIAREMFSWADGCTMSAKKDGMANIGGFLCTNNEVLAQKEEELLILTEGFPTYGGMSGRDLEAIAVGLYEAVDPNYLRYRAASTAYLGNHLAGNGVPIVQPPGGHAIYLDAKSLLPHIPVSQYPGQALVIAMYQEAGIRSVEIGSVMFGKYNFETGEETYARHELVRLAIPRRVYTKSQMDYVVESLVALAKKKDQIRGIKIVKQPPALRHFSASFAFA